MRCFDLSLTFSVRVHCRTLIGRACHSNTNQINGQLGCAGHGISCASSIASSAPPRVCDSGCVALAGFGVQAQISRGGTTQGLSSEVIFVGCFCGPQCALWAAASVAARCWSWCGQHATVVCYAVYLGEKTACEKTLGTETKPPWCSGIIPAFGPPARGPLCLF